MKTILGLIGETSNEVYRKMSVQEKFRITCALMEIGLAAPKFLVLRVWWLALL